MPDLVTVRDVELIRTGKWSISTGEWDVTPELITAAIDAHTAGVLRKPVIRLGHNDPRFSGDPAVGYVDNLRASADGSTLIGDLMGVPEWLAKIMGSAYPDRSVEGLMDYTAPDGSEHPFVLTGLGLLGVTRPGVESLKSLQDVARLYDIAAAGRVGGTAIEVSVPAGSSDAHAYTSTQLTTVESSISDQAATVAQPEERAVMASFMERIAQRLGIAPDADEETIEAALTEALAEQAEIGEVAAPAPADPTSEQIAAAAERQGLVVVDAEQYKTTVAAVQELQTVEAARRQERREQLVNAAVSKGKIAPASREAHLTLLEKDPGHEQVLASIPDGLLPVSEMGHSAASEKSVDDDDVFYASLFGSEA